MSSPRIVADVVGSLLRPADLLEARGKKLAGQIDPPDYKRIEDKAVDAAIALQEECGLDAVTDGELRRMFFTGVITEALEGLEFIGGAPTSWHTTESEETEVIELPVVITGKLGRRGSLGIEEFAYARARASRTVKVTLPSPLMLSYFWSPDHSGAAYNDPFDMFADAAAIVREQAAELIAMGCEYIQYDAPELITLVDPEQAEFFAHLGIDPERMLTEGLELIDHCADLPGARFAMHLCRGNNRGRWLASGGYDSIASKVFAKAKNFDAFALEYDSPRAGTFDVLGEVPDDKTVILGLVSTKVNDVEPRKQIEARLEAAAGHFPRQQLALSTQCGFASEDQGNPVTPEHQKRKLQLVAEVAHDSLT